MKNENLFDMENTTDLPEELRKSVKKRLSDGATLIFPFFSMKNPLSVNEARIAMYRKHKRLITYSQAVSALELLTRRGFIEKVGKSSFQKIEQ